MGVNPIARFGYRATILARNRAAALKKPKESLRYLFRSREGDSFTYELANVEEMLTVLADALEADRPRLAAYARELHSDAELREELSAALRTNPRRDDEPRYGKRTMDYCIVRARRPGVVIEIGTHDGLGASVILRALQRNAAEGEGGVLHCFDIADEAGWLVPDGLREKLTLHLGDVRQNLEPVVSENGVDFVNSDIGPHYEGKQWALETACRHARGQLVIRDEEADGSLPRVAEGHNARHRSFQERPDGHFWPGNLIGVAVFPPPD